MEMRKLPGNPLATAGKELLNDRLRATQRGAQDDPQVGMYFDADGAPCAPPNCIRGRWRK
jgi:hypothetical protein